VRALDIQRVIEAPAGSPWLGPHGILQLLDKESVWREHDKTKPLNHIAPAGATFPWRCPAPGCTHVTKSREEEVASIAVLAKQNTDKSKVGKARTAMRVKAFAEMHDEHMEYQVRI
jgi:hypothetical protein